MSSGGAGGGFSSQVLVWATAAFVLGAPVGFLGNLARMSGGGGLGFRLTVPLIAFCETSVRLSTEAHEAGSTAGATWNVVRVVAAVAALALVGHAVWSWRNGRRQQQTVACTALMQEEKG